MSFHALPDETAEWLSYLQPEGLVVGANVLRAKALTPIRQTPQDTEAAAKALGLSPDAEHEHDKHFVLADPWRFFGTVLGWPAQFVAGAPGGPAIEAAIVKTAPEHDTLLAPAMAVLWNGNAEADVPAQALVLLHPTLDPDARNQLPGEWEASPHQRLERLLRETGVGVGLLVARNTLRLVYAPRGETAGWLTWPLAALGRVEGRPMLAGLKLCLGKSAFFVGAVDTRLRALLKASREAQNEVSAALSGQVLGALHELMRGLHRAAPDRIEALAERDPHHLYEGLLTCLMRLVFLLYAEDRDLLPTSPDPQLRQLWDSGYSIKTLYARLLTDDALNPDTMDARRGSWGQWLAVFRLIYDGHPDWVARRGGKLFDPDVFAFLEGREVGSARESGQVLPVSDGTILRILHGLMTVEGRSLSGEKIRERLSYRSLDVESIGSVYETVMGFTACRAGETMIALRDEKKLPAFVGLDTLLAQRSAERQKWLKDQSVTLSAKQVKGVKEAGSIAALLEAFGSAVDLRASPDGPIGAGTPYLQPTAERRRSGSHYTPRSLTEPIVRHALEPAFDRLGATASPQAVLALKVLDPACGSGAFLVEACRQLGTRLEQAWDMHAGEKPPIPPDEDEATHARRLVAQRCLYGVDRNPMAVDLARLSLWLATLARDHEFSFLDHALKSGDSLVGLTMAEIKAAHWDALKPGLPLFRKMIEDAVGRALEGREAIRNAPDDVSLAMQSAKHRRVEVEVEPARMVGDAVIAAFFSADKQREREKARVEVESWITRAFDIEWERVQAKAWAFRKGQGWRPFHWEIEFPEVFARKNPGFDAVVGNPPYVAGRSISGSLGETYLNWLTAKAGINPGQADLSAHFVQRTRSLCSDVGAVSIVATNTVAQGDSASLGLGQAILNGYQITSAESLGTWPGDAAVHVCQFCFTRFKGNKDPTLNGSPVLLIDRFLKSSETIRYSLFENIGLASKGFDIGGEGFILDASEFEQIRIKNPDELVIVRPHINGKELYSTVTSIPTRSIINFEDRSFREASEFPHLLSRVRMLVKPYRDSVKRKSTRENWWIFNESRPGLRRSVANLKRVLAKVLTSNTWAFQFLATDISYDQALVIIFLQDFQSFGVLQSRLHEIWAKWTPSTMKSDTRYTIASCFLNFPRPSIENLELQAISEQYYLFRAEAVCSHQEGLTRIYKLFDDHTCKSAIIQRLRELHDAMDQAVLRAYGWDDLADTLKPVFLTPETEDDHTYQTRYFWPADGRDQVLARLLALNAQRHAEEVAAGLAPAKGRGKARAESGEEAEELLDG